MTDELSKRVSEVAKEFFLAMLGRGKDHDRFDRAAMAEEAVDLAETIVGVVSEDEAEGECQETDSLDDLIAEARRLLDGFDGMASVTGGKAIVSLRSCERGWRADMGWLDFTAETREEAMRGIIANLRLELERVANDGSAKAAKAKAVLEGKP